MVTTQLYYATNRRHRGRERWKPTGYGSEPSRDGTENLRFGRVTIPVDDGQVAQCLEDECGFGTGNGERLVNDDIRQSIDGIPTDSRDRNREPIRHGWPNVWRLIGE